MPKKEIKGRKDTGMHIYHSPREACMLTDRKTQHQEQSQIFVRF